MLQDSPAPPRVYALRAFDYGSHHLAVGEVFTLAGALNDARLLRVGHVDFVTSWMRLAIHTPTGRAFINEQLRDAYARDYARPEMWYRDPRRYEPVPAWRMAHSVRFDPDGIHLKQGEIITPTHPAFLMLYADYVVSPHPLMVPAFVSDASPPGAPADPHSGHLVMEQTPYLSAAFQLQKERQPNGDLQLRPERTPLVQAANMDELFRQLLQPHWETIYTLGVNTLPSQVPDISNMVPLKGALIVVRVRDSGRNCPRESDYEYFLVQSIKLLACPARDTVIQPASPKAPARQNQGRHRRTEKTQEFRDLLEMMKTYVRCCRLKGGPPQIKNLYAHIGKKPSTVYRWCKDAVALEGYASAEDWLQDFPEGKEGVHC